MAVQSCCIGLKGNVSNPENSSSSQGKKRDTGRGSLRKQEMEQHVSVFLAVFCLKTETSEKVHVEEAQYKLNTFKNACQVRTFQQTFISKLISKFVCFNVHSANIYALVFKNKSVLGHEVI